jgi:hypothetical protein
MEYLKCDCGGEKFFNIIMFPIDTDNPEILIQQGWIKCIKCGKVLSADEVKKALGR